jgi:hypothetical protein
LYHNIKLLLSRISCAASHLESHLSLSPAGDVVGGIPTTGTGSGTANSAPNTAACGMSDKIDDAETVREQSQSNVLEQLDPTVIDHDSFEQILEIDEDDEREFSRALIMDTLETNGRMVSDLEKHMSVNRPYCSSTCLLRRHVAMM